MSENLGHVDLGLIWKDGGVEKRKVGNKKIKLKQVVSIENKYANQTHPKYFPQPSPFLEEFPKFFLLDIVWKV